jgi:chromosome segregation ATPase
MAVPEDFVELANKPLQRDRDTARQLIATLNQVKSEIQAKRTALEEVKARCASIQREVNTTKTDPKPPSTTELEAAELRFKEAADTFSKLAGDRFERAIDSCDAEKQRSDDAIQGYQKKLEDYEQLRSAVAEKVGQLEKEREAVEAERNSLASKLREYEEAVDQMRDAQSRYDQEREQLWTQIAWPQKTCAVCKNDRPLKNCAYCGLWLCEVCHDRDAHDCIEAE